MSTKYAVQPTPIRLFSSSLEAHMAAYTEEIKLNQLNQEYQLAQNRIIREGELYNLSQADLMNRLNALKEQLLNSIKANTIPLSKTNAPQMEAKEEKYIPMTASEYENKINRKPTIKIENRRDLIDELKEKLQKRKQTQMITEVFPEVNKREVNKLLDNVLTDLINKGLKRQEVMKGAENVVDNLLKDASKEAKRQEIKQFSKGYVNSLVNEGLSNINSREKKTPSEKPISSTATTSSDIEASENVGKSNFQQVKKQMREKLDQSKYIQALQEMEKLPSNEKIPYMNKKISGGGLKKKKAKKNK